MNPESTLKNYFGFEQFRDGQREIVDSILMGKNTLALLPTGGGKSICFQVPGLTLKGITIVVSPLISLMVDQVNNLQKKQIAACCIHSGLGDEETNQVFQAIKNQKYKFIYVAPERLLNQKFIELCQQIAISQLVIDEAHCISMWGNDFRPSYKLIPLFISRLRSKPIISAFTATATRSVIRDIVDSLQLIKPKIFCKSFSRNNLEIGVYHCWNQSQKNLALLFLLQKHHGESGIIYTATREAAKHLTKMIQQFSWSEKYKSIMIDYYHGALATEKRKRVQESFLNNQLQVIVATNAFGMGIDKPNIRFVIHYQIPANLENYYQEIGRAGRDGMNSNCYLLFFPGDTSIQKEMIETNKKITVARKKYLFSQLNKMINFAKRKKCLHQFILQHFGESFANSCHSKCNYCNHKFRLQIDCDYSFSSKIIIKQNLQLPNLTEEQLAYCQLLQPKNSNEFQTIPGIGLAWKNLWDSPSRLNVIK